MGALFSSRQVKIYGLLVLTLVTHHSARCPNALILRERREYVAFGCLIERKAIKIAFEFG